MTIGTIIGGIVILAAIGAAIYYRYKNQPSEEDRINAEKFLEGLKDNFYSKMLDIVNNINFKDYSSLEEVEVSILSEIYEALWIYTENELKVAAEKDIVTAMVLKVINKEFVDKFVDGIIEKNNIKNIITDGWAKFFVSNNNTIEEAEKEAETKFVGDDYNEVSYDEDLPAAEPKVIEEVELVNLNPPTDEGTELDPETDSSVEVYEEEKEPETFLDKNGRLRYKSNGRFVKVNK